MSSLLSDLNPQQLEAITLPHQSALVLAGAGSGKTRVLTTRIAHLVQTGQVSPQGILAVTFTNKAAKEMMARISAMLPINPRGMWVGTFHGLCNRMLRAHHDQAGLPQAFQILDTADQLAVIKRILKAQGVSDKEFPPRQIQWFINNAKEEGLRASQTESYDQFTQHMVTFYQAYEQRCNKDGSVDFPELLLRCYELLIRNELLRSHYCARFEHILVDEFQDTNSLQYKWLKLLAGVGTENRAAVFVVGDDDQSIYAFRGAKTENMKLFERDFDVSKVIKLEQNYRSHGNILDAANTLIQNNSGRLGKNLWTEEEHGEPLRAFNAATDFEEAAFIVDEIKALHNDGIALSQMALLYRSNAQSRVLEHSLFNASLPYRVYGGMRFFERQEIKHALAYLRLIANPDDDNAMLRIINFPTRGIGARTLEQLQDDARQADESLWATALKKCGRETAVNQESEKAKKGVSGFVALILAMRQDCDALPLPQVIEKVLTQSGLIRHYNAARESEDRLENLNELITAATSFVHEAEDDSLTSFLAHASLEAGEHQSGSGEDALQLMTVHAAKGLEFHSVFVSGLEEGLFPHENSRNEANGLEEERRLMYVALTRARRRLYLSFAQSRMLHGQIRHNVVSRFLDEIPENLMKWLQPAPQTNTAYYKSPQSTVRTNQSNRQNSATGQWRIGQNVSHEKFGVGVIVNCESDSSDTRVQVNFNRVGVKWLSMEFAKLTPV
jgi:DNA helicase-2/ATP-dependent DNA helicase PcrA